MAEQRTTHGGHALVEAPQTWRPGWLFVFLSLLVIPGWIRGTQWAPAPLRVLLLLLLVWYLAWYVVLVLNGKRWRVTFDGEVVDVRGRFGHWRFRPEDVTSVVVPTMAQTAVLRVDRVERTSLGVRIPWPWPWRRGVTPFVRPAWFVEVVGVPADRVRPGGLRWVASRLRRVPDGGG